MNLLDRAARDPYTVLRAVLGGPLHPGGPEATDELLETAGVGEGDVLVDLGCGAGEALALAQDRGARAIGLDERTGHGHVRARIEALPLAEATIDVVLAECSLCLAEDLDGALAEARRVLAPGGRLAFSDVTVDRKLPAVPEELAELLCLEGTRGREQIRARFEANGFVVEHVADHHEELLAMRERVHERVDVDGLLEAMGERGQRLAAAKQELKAGLEQREIGYISVVARLA